MIKIISYIVNYSSMIDRIDIIFSIDDNYYQISEELRLLKDVDQMPTYIKKDWYLHNKIELTEKVLNKHIYYNERKSIIDEEKNIIYNYLKMIKRNMIIDSIL